jgi:hypothetical protein
VPVDNLVHMLTNRASGSLLMFLKENSFALTQAREYAPSQNRSGPRGASDRS